MKGVEKQNWEDEGKGTQILSGLWSSEGLSDSENYDNYNGSDSGNYDNDMVVLVVIKISHDHDNNSN